MPNPSWVKGMRSPNPTGRTKMSDAQRMAREMREAAQPAIARMLIKMALDEAADPSHRLIAAKAILEDLPSQVEVSNPDGSGIFQTVDLSSLSDEVVMLVRDQLRRIEASNAVVEAEK